LLSLGARWARWVLVRRYLPTIPNPGPVLAELGDLANSFLRFDSFQFVAHILEVRREREVIVPTLGQNHVHHLSR
jgi:hypothetical protein